MPTLPKISIITPSYNQSQYIETTIQSVLEQEYPNLEYIVVDGGSTDGTLDVLTKFGSRLHWISEKDRGQSDALNKGLRLASGDIWAYINSDDLYLPGAFQRVGEYFATHSNVDWVTGFCQIIDQNGKQIRKSIRLYKNFWLQFRSYRLLQVIDYISQPATFWSRRVVDRTGMFNESLHYSMDYDYSLRVGQSYKLHVIPADLAAFRIHPASKSHSIRDHFNADLAIARSYTRSSILTGLHRIHNALIVAAYERLQSVPEPASSDS
jgi:glycosyltransferase involved in cell wall biosynthesis